MNTLLLTWTIKPNEKVLKQWYNSFTINHKKRLKEYINSIIFYISQSDFNNIVFCENSNYNIPEKDLIILRDLSQYYNKKIELLQFSWNYDKIKEKWYNYWEWECIDYAFDNSILIKESSNWYKISWRYKFWNINNIINEWNDSAYYFYRFSFPFLYWVVTEIFKCTNEIYWKYLYNVKDIVDYKKPDFLRSYEMMCYYKLRPILRNIKPLVSLPIHSLWTQNNKHTNRNMLFQLLINNFFLNKYLLHWWWIMDKVYSIFFWFYCKLKLKIK